VVLIPRGPFIIALNIVELSQQGEACVGLGLREFVFHLLPFFLEAAQSCQPPFLLLALPLLLSFFFCRLRPPKTIVLAQEPPWAIPSQVPSRTIPKKFLLLGRTGTALLAFAVPLLSSPLLPLDAFALNKAVRTPSDPRPNQETPFSDLERPLHPQESLACQ
jgi:hypothetical protein